MWCGVPEAPLEPRQMRKFISCRLASVLPAPLSPLTTMHWSARCLEGVGVCRRKQVGCRLEGVSCRREHVGLQAEASGLQAGA